MPNYIGLIYEIRKVIGPSHLVQVVSYLIVSRKPSQNRGMMELASNSILSPSLLRDTAGGANFF
jgi:hypothetical protein